jgi:hypothetical protein
MPPQASAMEYVTKFVRYFYQHICNGNVADIQTMYSMTFKALSDDYFNNKPWPRYEDLRKYVNDDLFWLMYQVRCLVCRPMMPSADSLDTRMVYHKCSGDYARSQGWLNGITLLFVLDHIYGIELGLCAGDVLQTLAHSVEPTANYPHHLRTPQRVLGKLLKSL